MSNSLADGNLWIRVNIQVIMMANKWREQGATEVQIGNELDERILHCGNLWFYHWLRNKNDFRLMRSGLTALVFCYGILRANGHVQEWTSVDFSEAEKEWRTWKLDGVFKKSELVKAVISLSKFAEIEMHRQDCREKGLPVEPFIVKQIETNQ